MFKSLFKEYSSGFSFFYSHLGKRIFLILILSLLMSLLDALGLYMFLPLFQLVNEEGSIDPSAMGKLSIIIESIQDLGISLTMGKIILVMLIFFILKAVVKYFGSIYLIALQQSFIRRIRLQLLNGLNQLNFEKFMIADTGRIQNTLSGEVDRISSAFTTYFGTLRNFLMAGVYLIFAFLINPGFAILVIVFGILSHFLFSLVYNRTRFTSRKLTAENNLFQGRIIQHVAHFKYLRSTGVIDKFSEKVKDSILSIENSRKRLGVLSSIGGAVVEPVVIVILVAVLYIQFNWLGGTLSTALVSLMFFFRAITSSIQLQAQWNTFLGVSGSLENIEDFFDMFQKNKTTDGEISFHKFQHEINIENLFFSYGKTPVLKDINLRISKNETIAFVGESGSGKTTLISLITGLLQPQKGSITIDGMALQEIKAKTFQKRIGYVSQDPVIFEDTLYNNICLWEPDNEQNQTHFRESIRKASLEEFINTLEDKVNTLLGKNGINLSGGQKQRVSIARELFKEVDILILDEATSSLDSETEKVIQESIDALQGSYTILIVAHRLSTIKNADRIVFMDKGKIIDIDSFENLMEKQQRFKRMVELQEL